MMMLNTNLPKNIRNNFLKHLLNLSHCHLPWTPQTVIRIQDSIMHIKRGVTKIPPVLIQYPSRTENPHLFFSLVYFEMIFCFKLQPSYLSATQLCHQIHIRTKKCSCVLDQTELVNSKYATSPLQTPTLKMRHITLDSTI